MATNAQIFDPAGVSVDKYQNIYIADIENYNVRKISPDGIITTMAGNSISSYSGDGGQATNASFITPGYASTDNFGNLIVTDGYAHVIRKVNAMGIVTTIAGNGTSGYSGDGGPAVDAKLNGPYGIVIDKQNSIIFAEYGNGVIRKIDGATGIISTIVGCGIQGFGGDGGPAINAKLVPDDIVIDSNGVMYIADYENNRIRMVYNDKLAADIVMKEERFSIYPNPAQNEITIKNAEGDELIITDVLGKVVFSKFNISNSETINIEHLPKGVYIVKCGTGHCRKLVVE